MKKIKISTNALRNPQDNCPVFKIKFGKILLICLFIFFGQSENAFAVGLWQVQAKTVTGTVTDGNGLPLPGVNVIERGTRNGTQTDFDGNYSIDVSSSDAVLIFSFVGIPK
mgnify:CR=1 FL=1